MLKEAQHLDSLIIPFLVWVFGEYFFHILPLFFFLPLSALLVNIVDILVYASSPKSLPPLHLLRMVGIRMGEVWKEKRRK